MAGGGARAPDRMLSARVTLRGGYKKCRLQWRGTPPSGRAGVRAPSPRPTRCARLVMCGCSLSCVWQNSWWRSRVLWGGTAHQLSIGPVRDRL